jgi:hypothetical protein
VVYYLSDAGPDVRRFWPSAAVADLRNPAYRAWRVAEARRVIATGRFDAVLLNDKFDQYRFEGGHWIGGAARDVEALNRIGSTLWSAPPDGYGYAEYVSGWVALGRDLRRAGVPYAVWTSAAAWHSRWYDAPETPRVDEQQQILETLRGSRLALVGGPVSASRARELDEELRASGSRLVLMDAARASCLLRGGSGPGGSERPPATGTHPEPH